MSSMIGGIELAEKAIDKIKLTAIIVDDRVFSDVNPDCDDDDCETPSSLLCIQLEL